MRRAPITIILFAALIVIPRFSEGQARPKLVQKTERFEADPGWEGFNNRVPPKKGQIVKQDFGYSPTHFAGRAAGEVGGVIQRSTTPASYAVQIAPRSLNDKLTAAGTFAITASHPGAGVFFGFFNSQQPGGSGRPFGARMKSTNASARVYVFSPKLARVAVGDA